MIHIKKGQIHFIEFAAFHLKAVVPVIVDLSSGLKSYARETIISQKYFWKESKTISPVQAVTAGQTIDMDEIK